MEQNLAEWQAAIHGSQPHPARWLDGTNVGVSVDLGAPEIGCLSVSSYGVSVGFDANNRMRTSDGRADTALVHGHFSQSALEDYRDLVLDSMRPGQYVDDLPRLSPAEFEAESGIHGINAYDSPWLFGYVGAHYYWRQGAVESTGSVTVTGIPSCAKTDGPCAVDPREYGADVECLLWPATTAFLETCGRHLR